MLDHSPLNLVFIRVCGTLLTYAPLIEASVASSLLVYNFISPSRPDSYVLTASYFFTGLLTLELSYAFLLYRPHKTRLLRDSKYPEPLTRADRKALFERCLENVSDRERYLRLWFLGADAGDVKRDNVRDFILWAFFDSDGHGGKAAGVSDEDGSGAETMEEEVESYVLRTEEFLGRKLPPGRGSATSLRLNIDAVHTQYRSVIWYSIVGMVDLTTHVYLSLHGFRYYSPSLSHTLAVFPPRTQALQQLLPPFWARKHRSASGEMGYWLRPHTSKTRLPIVFLHGIGIGLWPYAKFIAEINASDDGSGGPVGVLALEILPMSMRLTSPRSLTPATSSSATSRLC